MTSKRQNFVSRFRGSTSCRVTRREAPGPKPVRLGRRLRLRRQPPGSWQLWNGGVQRGVSAFLVLSPQLEGVGEGAE